MGLAVQPDAKSVFMITFSVITALMTTGFVSLFSRGSIV